MQSIGNTEADWEDIQFHRPSEIGHGGHYDSAKYGRHHSISYISDNSSQCTAFGGGNRTFRGLDG